VTVRLWLDVEDLFEYASRNPRPSGIQRLAFEICRALQEQYADKGLVHFVRRDFVRNDFYIINWQELATLFKGLASAPSATVVRTHSIRPRGLIGNFLQRLVYRLSPDIRDPFLESMRLLGRAALAWIRCCGAVIRRAADLAVALPGSLRQIGRRRDKLDARSANDSRSAGSFTELAAPGDVLLLTGAPWSDPNLPSLIRSQRARRGLRLGVLVCDLIPIRYPEWCEPGLVRLFRSWIDSILPLCDHTFAISRETANDVEAYAREIGVRLPRPVIPIPIGTGFGGGPPKAAAQASSGRVPAAGSYVLCVSTIEVRKNHLLLFRVWRRLLQDKPPGSVPTLVFAGRVGWLVSDLMQQITNTNHLNGNLLVVEDPTDAELTALYHGCLFTLFPSFCEGWGLPVSESLAFGKPCLIANRSSLPEAGGNLVRSFNPDNLDDAYAAIRHVIENDAELREWATRIEHEFQPTPWSLTAEALLTALDDLPSNAAALNPGQRRNTPARAGEVSVSPWAGSAAAPPAISAQ
jgi:glycosyltransferase involved in cell wall biosynthesis